MKRALALILLGSLLSPVAAERPRVRDLSVRINALEEFDFLTKDQVLERRRLWVAAVPALAPENYRPSEKVFGDIGHGKPWWGIDGMYGHGHSPRSIDGPSEESRFVVNPYLLVGVIEPHGWAGHEGPPDPAVDFYPVPSSLKYRSPSEASVRYHVTDHFSYLMRNNFADAEKRTLAVIAYNARDLGYTHLLLDQAASRGVAWPNGARPVRIRQLIHVGQSCGFEGGCNNASPAQPEMDITLETIPATAVFRLWRAEPASADAPADMMFTVEFF